MGDAPLLRVRGIRRRFGAVVANDGIDLDVRRGHILGLLGENGSGKSTLMRILFGMLAPDSGSIAVNGRPLASHRPSDAIAAGLAMIHQHFTLVEAASVLDNVMLGWPEAGRILRRRAVAARIRETGARLGLEIDPDARVSTLPLGRRQRVEILKAVLRGADLLILDEPTSNLAAAEVASLLAVLRTLRDAGAGIIFISHKLPEVLDLCDDVVVLRAGRVVASMPTAGASAGQLAAAMLGHAPLPAAHARQPAPGIPGPTVPGLCVPRLAVDSLTLPGLRGVDLTIRAGEVLGVAGVDGNGQLELVEAICGMRPTASGRVAIDGRDVTRASVAARLRAGLAYIPADRAHTALVPAMTVEENLALRPAPPGDRRAAALRLIAQFGIRASGPGERAANLSGGNRQKIVVARELDRAPCVLVAHQAAWGLDPAATAFVLERIMRLRASGAAVLYVSSELDEVLAVADRVAVMFAGRLNGVFDRAEVTAGSLGRRMSGVPAA